MDVQPVFNEYKEATYMRQHFSKIEDQCSQVMKKVAKEAFENNMHYHGTMKTIAKAYLSIRQCSVTQAVYHILPKLKLRRVFVAAYFVNINPLEERFPVLPSVKELSKLPADSPNIFKKSNINCYIERPSATFNNRKYSALNHFCYIEFLALYTIENKSTKAFKYHPDELDDDLIENNHEECS